MSKVVARGPKTSLNKTTTQHDLQAGEFSSWLRHIRNVLLGGSGIDVACGECIGCCTSSYFIHIKPHETDTLGRINRKILFPAPGFPKGHLLMGFDVNGHCPMLNHGQCTIYHHRPETCRNFDCRVFTAAGITAGDNAVINQRINQWKFSYPTAQDQKEHSAVQAAAKFIRENAHCFPGGRVPDNPSQLAILAIKSYECFLSDTPKQYDGAPSEVANAIVETCRQFDSAMSDFSH